MEPLLGLAVLFAAGYGTYQLGSKAVRTITAAVRRPAGGSSVLDHFHARRRDKAEHIARLKRRLYQALIRLPAAPDFRRAANQAAQAAALPAAMRHQFFRVFRPVIVKHYANRLNAGENAEVLLESLQALLTQLGVAAFEAEYLQAEAQRRLRPAPAPAAVPYAQRIEQLQRDHDQRTAALRGLGNIEREQREQLLEAEETRFQQALQALTTDDPNQPIP